MSNAALDRLIAERCMKWRIDGNGYLSSPIDDTAFAEWKFVSLVSDWHPTEDISQAFEALEKIRERQTPIVIRGEEFYNSGEWQVDIFDVFGEAIHGTGRDEVKGPKRGSPNLALAICLAIAEVVKP